jgi:hypothetical protein
MPTVKAKKAVTKVPIQALGLHKLTSGIYDWLITTLGGFIPEKFKAGVVAWTVRTTPMAGSKGHGRTGTLASRLKLMGDMHGAIVATNGETGSTGTTTQL